MASNDTSNTAEETLSATPYVKYLPDAYTDVEAADGASWELGAGHYEFGFEVNGAKIPLMTMKGGGVAKKLAAAKDKAAAESPPEPPAATPAA